MSVICEECGKIYHIPPEKINKVTGNVARFRCKECHNVITISKSGLKPIESVKDSIAKSVTSSAIEQDKIRDGKRPSVASQVGTKKEKKPSHIKISKMPEFKLAGLGLRGKMLILFLLVPLSLIAVSGFFSQRQLTNLASDITTESTKVVEQLAEEKIADKARSIALQSRIYLLNNPDLNKENFNDDIDFKKIVVQKVGLKGYSFICEKPGSEPVWWILAHPDPELVGKDVESILKKPLGKNFDQIFKIINEVQDGKDSKGYYSWKEKDGSKKEKFMVCTAIKGSPYVIASTACMKDFTGQIERLEAYVQKVNTNTKNINFGILAGSIIIIGLSISIYGYRLTNNIKLLTDAADRISVGELDEKIEITSTDEIGNLAEAISRMQDSLRLSIERLRERA